MKRILIANVVALSMMAGMAFAANGPAPKADVYHNGQWISVSCNAVPAHIAHGDKTKGCRIKL